MQQSVAIFDIILPSYNNKQELLACLEGFKHQTLKDFRVFACLDGSTDGSSQAVEPNMYPFPLLVVEHPDKQNHGRNATRNLAMPFLSSRYVLLFDSDCIPNHQLLAQHHLMLQQQPCISVGRISYSNASSNHWAYYLESRGYNQFQHFAPLPPRYLNTQNVALPTQVLQRLGGLDDNLVTYGGDDIELSIRIEQQEKLPIFYNKEAHGTGTMDKTLDKAFSQMQEFGQINLTYILKKHPNETLYLTKHQANHALFSKAARLIISSTTIAHFLKQLIPFLPSVARNKIIHFLVAHTIISSHDNNEAATHSQL